MINGVGALIRLRQKGGREWRGRYQGDFGFKGAAANLDHAILKEGVERGALGRLVKTVPGRDRWSAVRPPWNIAFYRHDAVSVGYASEDHVIGVLRAWRSVGEAELLTGLTIWCLGGRRRDRLLHPRADSPGPIRGLRRRRTPRSRTLRAATATCCVGGPRGTKAGGSPVHCIVIRPVPGTGGRGAQVRGR